MIRLLNQKQYEAIIDIVKEAAQNIEQLQKENEKLRKENDKLKSDINALIIENGILNNSMSCRDIDFPNSSNRSTDLYDPEDIF